MSSAQSWTNSEGSTTDGVPRLVVKFLPSQLEVFDCPAQNVVYAKGRRSGGTTGAANRLVELLALEPGSRHLWVDTTAQNILKIYRMMIRPLIREIDYSWNQAGLLLEFPNGAFVQFASTTQGTNLEGWGYDYFWINEAGLVLRNSDLYYSTLVPMSLESPKARWFFFGTPKGPGLFQEFYNNGNNPDLPAWASFRHSSFVNPFVNQALVDRLSKRMPSQTFNQEFHAQFLQGLESVFLSYRKQVMPLAELPAPVIDAHAEPLYVMGVDLARHQDYTGVWVLRAFPGPVVGVWADRWRGMPWGSQIQKLAGISSQFKCASMLVDATGLGAPVFEAMLQQGLPVSPVVISFSKKRSLIDALALAFESGELSIIEHQPTIDELDTFRRSFRSSGLEVFSAPPGGHDDMVISLALAWELARVQSSGIGFLGTPSMFELL